MKAAMAAAKQPISPFKPGRTGRRRRTLVFGLGTSGSRQHSPRPAGLLPNGSCRTWTFVVGQPNTTLDRHPHDAGKPSEASGLGCQGSGSVQETDD